MSSNIKMDILTQDNISKLTNWVGADCTADIRRNVKLGSLDCYYVFHFIFYAYRRQEDGINFYGWAPLKDENILLLRKDLNGMVLANAIGVPLIALLQEYCWFDRLFDNWRSRTFFWFIITAFTALLPVVGAALAFVPLAVIIICEWRSRKRVILLAFGLVVVGSVDNIFRFWLAKKLGDVHPLITVFGVLIGVNIFGFIGIIFGPILISLFLILIRIYANEFNIKRN